MTEDSNVSAANSSETEAAPAEAFGAKIVSLWASNAEKLPASPEDEAELQKLLAEFKDARRSWADRLATTVVLRHLLSKDGQAAHTLAIELGFIPLLLENFRLKRGNGDLALQTLWSLSNLVNRMRPRWL